MKKNYRIALLFNANKVYDRQVIEGVGRYLQASQCTWDIFIEDDFIYRPEKIYELNFDGIIADFDDKTTAERLQNLQTPLVAVGGSYRNTAFYPDLPYVATDNEALIEVAFSHLKQKGIISFAFYGLRTNEPKHWAEERKNAFLRIIEQHHHTPYLFQGSQTNSQDWQQAQSDLANWLQTLPLNTGIIAVTDARARHLLQACESLNIIVPEQLCVIGIDNEELIKYLSRVSLSSVAQGTKEIGYQAAKLLHKLLQGENISHTPILIPPVKVVARSSTDFRSLTDPYVIQAMHYIRHHACEGIRTEQVLDHLHISRSNLEQRFKQALNQTIHQVIYYEKLKRAKTLLKRTDVPIHDIAEVCGYPSLSYFYTVFKKEYQQTPKAFRLQKQ